MLSIHPKQMHDESIASYLLRLTYLNGFESVSDWLDLNTWEAATRSFLTANQSKQLSRIVPNASTILPNQTERRHSALFQSLTTDLPRVCPVCIMEGAYLKAEWQYIGSLQCEVHKVALIDCCNICQQPFRWTHRLLEGHCNNEACDKPLAATVLPAPLDELFIDEICDCLLASLFVDNRKITALPAQRTPQLCNIITKVSAGYKLLTDINDYQNFHQELTHSSGEWSNLPSHFKLLPWNLLTSQLRGLWPIADAQSVTKEIDEIECMSVVYSKPFIVTVNVAVNLLSLSKDCLKKSIPELRGKKSLPDTLRIDVSPLISSQPS